MLSKVTLSAIKHYQVQLSNRNLYMEWVLSSDWNVTPVMHYVRIIILIHILTELLLSCSVATHAVLTSFWVKRKHLLVNYTTVHLVLKMKKLVELVDSIPM